MNNRIVQVRSKPKKFIDLKHSDSHLRLIHQQRSNSTSYTHQTAVEEQAKVVEAAQLALSKATIASAVSRQSVMQSLHTDRTPLKAKQYSFENLAPKSRVAKTRLESTGYYAPHIQNTERRMKQHGNLFEQILQGANRPNSIFIKGKNSLEGSQHSEKRKTFIIKGKSGRTPQMIPSKSALTLPQEIMGTSRNSAQTLQQQNALDLNAFKQAPSRQTNRNIVQNQQQSFQQMTIGGTSEKTTEAM